MTEHEDETTDIEPEQSANLDLESQPIDIPKVKASKRESVLASLSILMEQAFEKGLSKKLDVRQQQKWFTIAAYLAQVMGRLVRDLDYESLRSEMDELKKRLETYNAPAGIDRTTQLPGPVADTGQSEDGQTADGAAG